MHFTTISQLGIRWAAVAFCVLLSCSLGIAQNQPWCEHVLMISFDGLRPDLLQNQINRGECPAFAYLQQAGLYTHNARTDVTHTVTLPNHTCMLTGLAVSRIPGLDETVYHGYTGNVDPSDTETLHNSGNPHLTYVPSVFDVAKAHGKRTAMFASKSKFSLFARSYGASQTPAASSENPQTGVLDVSVIAGMDEMQRALLEHLSTEPAHLIFVHYADADKTGHEYGWGSAEYLAVVEKLDRYLAQILHAIERSAHLRGNTVLLITADHGGVEKHHEDNVNPLNYTIPFYVFGKGIPAGNLYDWLGPQRKDPGQTAPDYRATPQPIRNGDLGNLALELLGLPFIPNSLMKGPYFVEKLRSAQAQSMVPAQ